MDDVQLYVWVFAQPGRSHNNAPRPQAAATPLHAHACITPMLLAVSFSVRCGRRVCVCVSGLARHHLAQ
jgi:hypothetical protein